MINQEIHLSAGNYFIPSALWAVQNDTGRSLTMHINDMVLVSGQRGLLQFVRSDGTSFGVDADVNLSTNSFYVENIGQALTQAGTTKCQLKIFEDDQVVSSYTFTINVLPSVTGTTTEQEYWTLENAILEALSQVEYQWNNKVDKTQTVNSAQLTGNVVLTSGNFAHSITNENMLAALTYLEVSNW